MYCFPNYASVIKWTIISGACHDLFYLNVLKFHLQSIKAFSWIPKQNKTNNKQ